MARKYTYYVLVADDGQTDETIENYREAFAKYKKAASFGHAATLYGFNDDTSTVIFSQPDSVVGF